MRAKMRQEGCREEFASLYAAHELQLFSYILALTGSTAAAEDVFQETCVVMWQKFSEFQIGTNFAAWARKIAYHMVMRYHKQTGRRHVLLGDAFVETISAVRSKRAAMRDHRSEALQHCLGKLGQRDRELLACRYDNDSLTIKDVAQKLGRPANTVYKALRRIRASLLECVRRTLPQGEHR
ncbi:MAG: sigma-70 family RNA polymerase sigma factor [Pirellulales bacterium]|nr:sigma-70 family RNA polymerase sigma factor [Pirellulales bacterium]